MAPLISDSGQVALTSSPTFKKALGQTVAADGRSEASVVSQLEVLCGLHRFHV